MFTKKSILALVIALVMTLGAMMLPAGAISEEDTYLAVDFSSGAPEMTNSMGELLDGEIKGADITYTEDSTLGRNVAVFDGTGFFKLPAAMVDMNTEQYYDYAFEILVNVAAATEDEYIFGNMGDQSGTGMAFSGGHMVFWAHDGDEYKMLGLDLDETKNVYDNWVHLVGVYDDAARKLSFYVNGKLVDSADTAGPINHWVGQSGTTAHLILGGNSAYSGGDGFNGDEALIGKVAYFNLYSIVPTDEDVAELYKATGLAEEPSDPSEEPSDPSEEPSASPSESAGNSGSTPVPTKGPSEPNAGTFDMGIISFAAVSLSSLVVAKRRRK